jgi:hypothetical protein
VKLVFGVGVGEDDLLRCSGIVEHKQKIIQLGSADEHIMFFHMEMLPHQLLVCGR